MKLFKTIFFAFLVFFVDNYYIIKQLDSFYITFVILGSQEIKDCPSGSISGISAPEHGIGRFQIADGLLPQTILLF